MHRGQLRHTGFLGMDRERTDVFREINELRRSRSLPEYQPRTTTFRVLPRRPSRRRSVAS